MEIMLEVAKARRGRRAPARRAAECEAAEAGGVLDLSEELVAELKAPAERRS